MANLVITLNPVFNELSNSSCNHPHLIHNMVLHTMNLWCDTQTHITVVGDSLTNAILRIAAVNFGRIDFVDDRENTIPKS